MHLHINRQNIQSLLNEHIDALQHTLHYTCYVGTKITYIWPTHKLYYQRVNIFDISYICTITLQFSNQCISLDSKYYYGTYFTYIQILL